MAQRKNKSQSTIPKPHTIFGEIHDRPVEQADETRRQQIELMLAQLTMSPVEKQFIIRTAEKMVDLVCDEYLNAVKQDKLNQECISAAATVAMMIVYDG